MNNIIKNPKVTIFNIFNFDDNITLIVYNKEPKIPELYMITDNQITTKLWKIYHPFNKYRNPNELISEVTLKKRDFSKMSLGEEYNLNDLIEL